MQNRAVECRHRPGATASGTQDLGPRGCLGTDIAVDHAACCEVLSKFTSFLSRGAELSRGSSNARADGWNSCVSISRAVLVAGGCPWMRARRFPTFAAVPPSRPAQVPLPYRIAVQQLIAKQPASSAAIPRLQPGTMASRFHPPALVPVAFTSFPQARPAAAAAALDQSNRWRVAANVGGSRPRSRRGGILGSAAVLAKEGRTSQIQTLDLPPAAACRTLHRRHRAAGRAAVSRVPARTRCGGTTRSAPWRGWAGCLHAWL